MDSQKFGLFLQARRKELGLTQAQLAEMLHVTDKAVSRWERGVGLPDINLLEPLAQALDLSLTELVRSERLPEETLTRDDADAAVADTLALAETSHRKAKSLLYSFLIWVVQIFLLGIILRFVDMPGIRGLALFVVIWCGSIVSGLVDSLLYPERHRKKKHSWQYYLKCLILTIALLLYPVIFFSQPYIGLERCGELYFLLTVLLIAWGLWEVHRYVEKMPTEPESE